MTPYRIRPGVVLATQWFKAGDHPEDEREWFTHPDTGEPFLGEGKVVRYYRNPYDSGERECGDCGHAMHDHGWIDVPPKAALFAPETS